MCPAHGGAHGGEVASQEAGHERGDGVEALDVRVAHKVGQPGPEERLQGGSEALLLRPLCDVGEPEGLHREALPPGSGDDAHLWREMIRREVVVVEERDQPGNVLRGRRPDRDSQSVRLPEDHLRHVVRHEEGGPRHLRGRVPERLEARLRHPAGERGQGPEAEREAALLEEQVEDVEEGAPHSRLQPEVRAQHEDLALRRRVPPREGVHNVPARPGGHRHFDACETLHQGRDQGGGRQKTRRRRRSALGAIPLPQPLGDGGKTRGRDLVRNVVEVDHQGSARRAKGARGGRKHVAEPERSDADVQVRVLDPGDDGLVERGQLQPGPQLALEPDPLLVAVQEVSYPRPVGVSECFGVRTLLDHLAQSPQAALGVVRAKEGGVQAAVGRTAASGSLQRPPERRRELQHQRGVPAEDHRGDSAFRRAADGAGAHPRWLRRLPEEARVRGRGCVARGVQVPLRHAEEHGGNPQGRRRPRRRGEEVELELPAKQQQGPLQGVPHVLRTLPRLVGLCHGHHRDSEAVDADAMELRQALRAQGGREVMHAQQPVVALLVVHGLRWQKEVVEGLVVLVPQGHPFVHQVHGPSDGLV
mmetsp:Transcript_9806/g.31110  ORF Transcript_9806/g.31110 Transcript_9806/m.31110 type:complete len:589 (+) Transcript_9806:87-1853(+)